MKFVKSSTILYLHSIYLNYIGHKTITSIANVGTKLKENVIIMKSQIAPGIVKGTNVNFSVSSAMIISNLDLNFCLWLIDLCCDKN